MTGRTTLRLLALGVTAATAACAIDATRDGIGRACDLDRPCPADHVCVLDEPTGDAAGAGVCAPVLDYGACQPPTWPVRVERAVTGDRDVTDPGALLDLDGVRRVQGELRLRPQTAIGALVVGDLCPLAGLQVVDAALIVNNTDVAALDGLQSLGAAVGGVAIVDNARLEDVRGLASLQFAPPPDGLAFGVFLGSNRQLEPAAVEELRAALEPVGVKVVGCGNKGERDCDGTFAPVLAEARRR